MINFFIRIILLISIWFNAALYFGWMDLGQYRNYVNSRIEDIKEIANSEEVKNLWNLIGEKLDEWAKDLSDKMDLEKVAKDLQSDIIKVGVDKAKKNLEDNYKDLTSDQINEIVNAAVKTLQK